MKKNRKTYTGVVVSDKMDKTIVVQITTHILHKLYKKYVTHTKRIKAHVPENNVKTGDVVVIEECRPISKEKKCRLVEVLQKAQ